MTYHNIADILPLITDDGARDEVATHLHETTTAGPSGTMRAWFTARDGRAVNTVQGGAQPWAPLARTVDASRAGRVRLDGSSRDYAGCRVLGVTDDALLVATGGNQILYWTV